MTNEITTPIFNKVLFTPFYNPNVGKDRPITYIDNENDIIKPKNKIGCEYVGDKIVSPYFDTDYKISFETPKNDIKKMEEEKRNECLTIINKCFDKYDVSINESDKKCRLIEQQGKKAYKISQRYYVKGVVMKNSNILKLLNINGITEDNKPFDLGVYNDTRILLLPYTHKPEKPDDKSKTILEPIKKTDEDFNVFNYCATYIKETDINLDYLFEDDLKILKPKKKEIVNEDKVLEYKDIKKEEDEDEEEMKENLPNIEVKLLEYINILSVKRADNYDDWLSMMFCIINICNKHKVPKRRCYEYLHTFSKKCSKYEEDDIDKWIDKCFDKAREKGYLWNYLKHTCIKEDAPEYYKKRCGGTYYIVKKEFEKNVRKCMNPVGFLRIVRDELVLKDNPEPFQFMKEAELKSSYIEETYWTLEKDKKGVESLVEKRFINTWLLDKEKIKYERIIFKPYHLDAELSKKYYNLYEGIRAELLPVNKNYENIKPVLDHIKNVMVDGNEAHYDWFIQYLAQIIQNPTKKTEVCLIFRGKQGCGKNIIIDAFANGILGKQLSISTGDPAKTFFGTFNGCTRNKILGVCNEVGADIYNCMDRLKDLITSSDTTSENKNKDRIIVENYINIIMTTNNTNPLNISIDDRRIVWFECNNEFIGNEKYFNDLAEILEDDKNISAFYHYLKNEVKITISNFQKNRPITSGYLRTQQLNLPSYVKWCKDLVKDKDTKFKKYNDVMVYISKKKNVYDSYKLWCDTNKYIALKRDTFLHYLEDKDTGITKIIHNGYESFRFNQLEVNKWLDSQGINKTDTNIEVIDGYDFLDDDK